MPPVGYVYGVGMPAYGVPKQLNEGLNIGLISGFDTNGLFTNGLTSGWFTTGLLNGAVFRPTGGIMPGCTGATGVFHMGAMF